MFFKQDLGLATAIIQARLRSKRLPFKVLRYIGDKPMLQHVIERVQRARSVGKIIVATTTRPEDEAILDLARECGVLGFAGSEKDVLGRFIQALRHHAPAPQAFRVEDEGLIPLGNSGQTVVRITGDCPLVDPELIDASIDFLFCGGYDLVSSSGEGAYPDGMDVECVARETLEIAAREAITPYDREHVTPFILARPERFRIGKMAPEVAFPRLKLSVDTQEDLDRVRRIVSVLGPFCSLGDIVEDLGLVV